MMYSQEELLSVLYRWRSAQKGALPEVTKRAFGKANSDSHVMLLHSQSLTSNFERLNVVSFIGQP